MYGSILLWSQCGSANCVNHIIVAPGGMHFRYTEVRFRVDAMQYSINNRRAVINHEFGHVVGLCDPIPHAGVSCDPPTTSWSKCSSASVMHQFNYYGCSVSLVVPMPGADDIANVIAQMNTYP